MAFQIKKDRKESENKTIRFPLELIDRINMALVGSEVSFSSFVIQACIYALDNMDNNDVNENNS
ncbi:MAG: YlcI/YnfO family protein [Lachnospiraceae bacterium]|nr:YlcI/YnfO family protein [Lachnospiraceae bacterium]